LSIVLGSAKVISEPSILSGNSISFQVEWISIYYQTIDKVKSKVPSFYEASEAAEDVFEISESVATELITLLNDYKQEFESKSPFCEVKSYDD
jgi:hypothetical protein